MPLPGVTVQVEGTVRGVTTNMDGGKDEDLFFLSNGHISPVFYSVLARSGYFPVDELNTFRLIDSRLQGHPTTHCRAFVLPQVHWARECQLLLVPRKLKS